MARLAAWTLLATLILVTLSTGSATAEPRTESPDAKDAANQADVAPLIWHTSYAKAMREAKSRGRMLLVYFEGSADDELTQNLERQALADANVQQKLRDYVLVRLPLDATISVEGKSVQLIEHGAFGDLGGSPGLAIIDLVHRDAEYYEHVVTAMPVRRGRYYSFEPKHVAVALDLPPGTLTQRTMILAVRIHPEGPASTNGSPDETLLGEAANHSDHQATIRVQGHHNWGHRFQRIGSLLPGGLRPQEVVAESWPGENLMDAAVDCVRCWRMSSGHWSAVRRWQPRFGYDMRRGNNGIWYATGIFGNRH